MGVMSGVIATSDAGGILMLHIGRPGQRIGHGVTRRELLQVGGIGVLGLTLADWWHVRDLQASPSSRIKNREPSCIFIFLSGGPSHHETFDPKPAAPINIRGPYGAIPTNVPSIQIGELLPAMSQHMDKCAILRSMTSRDEHAGTTMMSGGSKSAASYGAVLTKIQGADPNGMPGFVHVGPPGYLPGAGNLGSNHNPVLVPDPSGKQVQLPQFALTTDISAQRFGHRRELLDGIERTRARWHADETVSKMDANYQRAIDLLTSDKIRAAFDLA